MKYKLWFSFLSIISLQVNAYPPLLFRRAYQPRVARSIKINQSGTNYDSIDEQLFTKRFQLGGLYREDVPTYRRRRSAPFLFKRGFMDTYVKGFNDMKGRPTISGWWTEM